MRCLFSFDETPFRVATWSMGRVARRKRTGYQDSPKDSPGGAHQQQQQRGSGDAAACSSAAPGHGMRLVADAGTQTPPLPPPQPQQVFVGPAQVCGCCHILCLSEMVAILQCSIGTECNPMQLGLLQGQPDNISL